ncbi:hypothetical protein GBK02_14895 [Dechloromonas sp. TW-R-39-2]|uniref:phage NrS-1 polymerase family protein n=1 Tax=Dechloromonas sp. TW-R-39-2 TaxID=2654218 RepID=UPI00193E3CA3|nr:VapE domain-containing protein [Dechloromonas sp. TW-R-39-2]QRM20578.1 hypothetical protein GBK02_14895 [Dechloromonas sp. TW-R-39-2]
MSVEMKSSKTADGYSAVLVDCDVIQKTPIAGLRSQWGVWCGVWRDGQEKVGKLPHNGSGKAISVDDPDSWLTFGEARNLYESGGYDGVGVLMSSLVGFVGIDLDDCIGADGRPNAEHRELVEAFVKLKGYVELSPSGKGLRQFIRGKLPTGYKQKISIGEIYDYKTTRYLTMTGVVWPAWKREQGGPYEVVENQAGLVAFLSQWWEKVAAPKSIVRDDDIPIVQRSVAEVLALLKRHNQQGKVTRLLDGDTTDHSGDHSSADLALSCHIAYFSRDPVVIDAVMRGSGLIRPKWDEMRGAETYGQRTIHEALERQGRSYDADQSERKSEEQKSKADRSKLKRQGAEFLVGGIDDLLTSNGKIRSDAWVACELLLRDKRLIGAMHFDEFSGYAICNRPLSGVLQDRTAPNHIGRIDDDMLDAFCRWIARQWGLSLNKDQTGAAVFAFARSVRVNPVLDCLNTLESQWDGIPRLDAWLRDCCNAVVRHDHDGDISEYVAAIGSKFLISAIARAFNPGCKVDTLLVLEGAQGAMKSSAARVIAEVIGAEYFREAFHLAGSKDDYIALRGRWIVEWGELSGMSRSDRNELKTFATKQCDPYRQPWDKLERDWPRSCVFICTTNDDQYLSDPTGNRRFWPVKVGQIDIARLRRDAPMILAEAVVRYKAGERWWFDDNDPRDQRLMRMAEREQAKRVGGTFFGEVAADVADALVCGRLSYTNKAGELAEALPWDRFSRNQIIEWLSQYAGAKGGTPHDDDKQQRIRIDDSNWSRVTAGLIEAGWWKTKVSNYVWSLKPERLEALRQIHGRDIGPAESPMRSAKRNKREP